MRNKALIAMSLVMMLAASAARAADAPFNISYMGRLADGNDKPVEGPVDLAVRFYKSASGGSPIIGALNFPGVKLTDGVYQIDINKLDKADLHKVFSGAGEVWIAVSDVTHNVTYPRQALTAVPFALKVPVDGDTIGYNADGELEVVGGSAAGSVAEADHADEADVAITANKIQNIPVLAGTPANGDVLKYSTASSKWEYSADVGGGGGEINTASSVGGGTSIVKDKNSVDLRFKSLLGDGGITLSASADEVTINGSNLLSGTLTDGLTSKAPTVDLLFDQLALKRDVATDIPLATDVTGVLPVANGGTGVATLTGIVKANGTGAFSVAADADFPNAKTLCADGQFLQGEDSTTCKTAAQIVTAGGGLTAETDPQVGANTTGYLSKWDGSALVASAISESSGNIGIGIGSPSHPLHVEKSFSDDNGFFSASKSVAGSAPSANSSTVVAGSTSVAKHTGTFNNASGMLVGSYSYLDLTGASAVHTGVGLYSKASVTSTQLNNAYGLMVDTPTDGGTGSIQNFYGVYVADPGAVPLNMKYGLFVEGAGLKNYVAGRLGIGISTPTGILDVQGGMNAVGPGTDIMLSAQGSSVASQKGGDIYLMPGTPGSGGTPGKVKIGVGSHGFTSAGACVINPTTIATTAGTYTCTGVPGVPAAAVVCSPAGSTSNASTVSCRNSAANQLSCQASVSTGSPTSFVCMWMTP